MPMYFNFGGIGAVIGHELTHGFDNTGRKYDEDGKHLFYTFQTISYNANHYYIYIYIYIYISVCVYCVTLLLGNRNNWWDEETEKTYLDKAECMKNQYNNYNVKQINRTVDGQNTLGENIADNGGAKEAYYAYRKFNMRKNV